jgi:hypothetical protein
MKLVSLGSKPEIKIAELSLEDGTKVLFSYGTPVAALVPGKGYIRTDRFISPTTERHIAFWCDSFFKIDRVPNDIIEGLLAREKV